MEIATTWHQPSSFLPRHRNSLPDRFWLWMAAWACRWPGKSPSSPTVEERPFQGRVTNEAKMGFSPLCSTRESVTPSSRDLSAVNLLLYCCDLRWFDRTAIFCGIHETSFPHPLAFMRFPKLRSN